MKFGKLTLRKIIKIFATRCLILGLKCTKNRSQLGLSAPPDPLAGFGGPTSRRRGRGGEGKKREGKGGKGRGGEEREGEEMGGDGKGRREKRERGGRLLFQTF